MGAGRGKHGGGQKSLLTAYALWLVFGAFGAHLFYVRRDRHCFLALITMNFFGFGWLRDAWRLPEYVRAANDEHEWSQRLAQRMRTHQQPAAGNASGAAQFVCASYLGLVGGAAVFYIEWLLYGIGIGWHVVSVQRQNVDTERMERVNEEQLLPWCVAVMELLRHVCTALGAAVGVILAGTCDPTIRCAAPWRVVGVSVAVKLAAAYGAPTYDSNFWVAAAAMHAFSGCTQWNRARTGTGRRCACCWRVMVIGLAATVVAVLLCVHVYTSVEFDGSNGEKVKLTDAFRNFKRSKAYAEMWQFLHQCWDMGFWESLKMFADSADLDGTDAAYDALGIERDKEVTARELRKVRNDLALRYHPDKFATAAAEEKAAAELRFREIQDAFDTLMRYAVKKDGATRNGRGSAEAAANTRATAAAQATAQAAAAAERVKAAYAKSAPKKSAADDQADAKARAKAKAKMESARAAGKAKAKRSRL